MLFLADGWNNATTRGIAAAAGIATGILARSSSSITWKGSRRVDVGAGFIARVEL